MLLPLSRRGFLERGLASLTLPVLRSFPERDFSTPAHAARTRPLLERFPDLRRHFVFEYYPWYGAFPYRHWDQWDRRPPLDIASNYMPRLGAYDSRSAHVVEQHARSIADSGAGAINLSWWGPGSFEDAAVPLVMDVMRDHDIKVAFHLEPYRHDHGRSFADDALYLIREYGEKRGFDAWLLLRDEQGRTGPVFKGFRTILPETETDCHGVTRPVLDYLPDSEWRRETDALRQALAGEFDQLALLADTVNVVRAAWSGFDGIAVYDPFVPPQDYAAWALAATTMGLVFSFNVNPGFDAVAPRDPASCGPPATLPDTVIDWGRREERERAALLAERRIEESFDATLQAQTEPRFANFSRGFFLVYLNSFNEWHEGTALEPMRDAAALSPEERRHAYHNPEDGGGRLRALKRCLGSVLAPKVPPRAPQEL